MEEVHNKAGDNIMFIAWIMKMLESSDMGAASMAMQQKPFDTREQLLLVRETGITSL